jgi:hypothetical protein
MEDDTFQARLKKLYSDHARFMALLDSVLPPSEEQKLEMRAKALAEETRIKDARRAELAREARQGSPRDKYSPDPNTMFPPLPWRPAVFLRLASAHWKANIMVCKRIHFINRQLRVYAKWLSDNAPASVRFSEEELESFKEITNRVNSHVTVLRITKRPRAHECIPPEELLGLLQYLTRVYQNGRRLWTPELRTALKAAWIAEQIEMAPLRTAINEMMDDVLKNQNE